MREPVAVLIFVALIVLAVIGFGFGISVHILTSEVLANRAHGELLQQMLCTIIHHDHLIVRGC